MSKPLWFQVRSIGRGRGFVAGGDYNGREVTAAAPVIKYMEGWSKDEVDQYCKRKQWLVRWFSEEPDGTG